MLGSVMDTYSWSDEDWRVELEKWDDEKLLATYVSLTSFNEQSAHPTNWIMAKHAYQHARHCLYGAILERMGSRV